MKPDRHRGAGELTGAEREDLHCLRRHSLEQQTRVCTVTGSVSHPVVTKRNCRR